METTKILNRLEVYQNLLNDLQIQELSYLNKSENFIRLKKSLTLEYSFIRLELIRVSKENTSTDKPTENLYCQLIFQIKDDIVIHTDTYCEDQLRIPELKQTIHNHQADHCHTWSETISNPSSDYDKSIKRYLDIADSIAKQAHNCSRGDDYRPGFYSKIMITETVIKLSQINTMNSKSIDHKQNYHLRKLEFLIPLDNQPTTLWFDYRIGSMLLNFSDNSSVNNRSCGNFIKEQIEKEMQRFKLFPDLD